MHSNYWLAHNFGNGALLGGPSNQYSLTWWRDIWQLHSANKIKVFHWRAFWLAIPCTYELCKRKIPIDLVCSICLYGEETVLHAMWRCQKARRLWKHMDLFSVLKGDMYVSFQSLCQWAFSLLPEL